MSTTNNVLTLLARLVIGVILIAHGYEKFAISGIEGIAGFFDSIGVPLASVAAPLTAAFEILAGVMIVLGLFTRVISALTAVLMLLAALFAHLSAGIFVADGGWELVGAIGAAALMFAAAGAGAYSLDHAIKGRRSANPVTAATPADYATV